MRRPGGARLRRRELLRAGVCGGVTIAAVLGAAAAPAQTRTSKAAVAYQTMPNGGLSCAVCTLFRPPHACVVVQGDISAHGWCKLFSLPD